MSPLATAPSPAPSSLRRRTTVVGVVAVVALLAVGFALLAPLLRTPERVARVVVENPHDWRADVDVSSGDGRWMRVGSVAPRSTATFLEQIDQGELWVFRFRYAGEGATEVTMSAGELESGPSLAGEPDISSRLSPRSLISRGSSARDTRFAQNV